ncbi:TlpA family protein disulfide reductase [Flavobacterium difficile]|uniref:TlpA family protein disulfide reductase n=1 Tax=Flavobacterium difficile TaxID=2709659 RepID=A0ABX0IAP1_9FLAO|nr:TlpA disulfide reductase family protein [Flavobacterium difficile]NHM02491.1 TlpA family protein disulfide reductase [Flavobacterium difficile]
MKKILATLALGLSLTACQAQETEFSKESLKTNLTTIDNKDISFEEILKQNEGKTIVIEVWASWCSDCIKSMPQVKELKASNPDVAFVNLSCDKTFDAWKTGVEKYEVSGANFLIKDGMKGAFGKSIKLDWIPRFIVVDKNGKIALFRAIEKDFELIQKTIEQTK